MIQRIHNLLRDAVCPSDSRDMATHMFWQKPSLLPSFSHLSSKSLQNLPNLIAASFVESRNYDAMPCVHEMASELFPAFLDLDDLTFDTDLTQFRELVEEVIEIFYGQIAAPPDNPKIAVFTNRPSFMIHNVVLTQENHQKYGCHIIFDQRTLATTEVMKAAATYISEKLKATEMKDYCTVDVQMFSSRPKLRMPYCDKGHPYPQRFYGLYTYYTYQNGEACKIRWDQDELQNQMSVQHQQIFENIRNGSIYLTKAQVKANREAWGAFITFVFRGEFSTWLKRQRSLRNLYYRIHNTVSRSCKASLGYLDTSYIYHNCKTYYDVREEIIHILRPLVANPKSFSDQQREEITKECLALLNSVVFTSLHDSALYMVEKDDTGNPFVNQIKKTSLVLTDKITFVTEVEVPVRGRPPQGEILATPVRTQTKEVVKEVPFLEIWSQSDNMRVVESVFFNPRAIKPDYVPQPRFFNTFPGYKRDPAHFVNVYQENKNNKKLMEELAVFREWMRLGLCGGNIPGTEENQRAESTKYRNYMEKLVKFQIEFPWKRSGVAVSFYGNAGTGKGFFLQGIAKAVYGENSPLYKTVVDLSYVFGNYTMDGLEKTLMLIFDETEVTKKHLGAFKSTTTDERFGLNVKYEKQKQASMYYQGWFTSNSEKPVMVEKSDRRWFIVKTTTVSAHLNKLVKRIEQEDNFLFHLWIGYVLSEYPEVKETWHAQSERPKTPAYNEMKLKHLSYPHQWWFQCLQRKYHALKPEENSPHYKIANDQNWIDRGDSYSDVHPIWWGSVNIQWLYISYFQEFDVQRQYKMNTFMDEIAVIIGMDYTSTIKRNFLHQGNLEIPNIRACVNLFCKHHDISPNYISPEFGNMVVEEEKFDEDTTDIFEHFHKKMGMKKRAYESEEEEEEEEEFLSPGEREERISDLAWKRRRREEKGEDV